MSPKYRSSTYFLAIPEKTAATTRIGQAHQTSCVSYKTHVPFLAGMGYIKLEVFASINYGNIPTCPLSVLWLRLKNKTAIFTGGVSGICRAVVIMSAREGCFRITMSYFLRIKKTLETQIESSGTQRDGTESRTSCREWIVGTERWLCLD